MDILLRLAELGLKGLVMVLLFFVVPYIVGCLPVLRWKWQPPGVAAAIVFGTVLLWAIFVVIAIPCILWWGTLSGLVTLVLIAWGSSALASLMLLKKEVLSPLWALGQALQRPVYLPIVAIACIGMLTAVPVLLKHQDQDDATYVVLVNDAVQTDLLYGRYHYTGDPFLDEDGRQKTGAVGWQRIAAPFPLLVACYARFSAIHPTIMNHTILPGVLIPLAFMVFYLLAQSFFPNSEGRWIFLLILSLALVFGGFSAWTTGAFLLLRIWQGKALLAAIFLPLLYCLLVQEQGQGLGKAQWFALFTVNLAATLTTTMTSVFVPFVLLAFCVVKCWRTRQFLQTLALAGTGLPALAQGALFHLAR